MQDSRGVTKSGEKYRVYSDLIRSAAASVWGFAGIGEFDETRRAIMQNGAIC
jgi:hypothetical protein